MNLTRRTPRKRLRSSSWMPATAARDNETLDHLLSFRCRDPCYSASIPIRKCDTIGLVGGRELRKNRPSLHIADIESPTSNRRHRTEMETLRHAAGALRPARRPVVAGEALRRARMRRRDVLALFGGAAASLPCRVRAQSFPGRAVTLEVGFPPGGTADLTARIVADRMKASLGQSVIIENVPGSGGSIGAGRVAHAPADGYTLACGSWGTHVVNGAILPLTYHAGSD